MMACWRAILVAGVFGALRVGSDAFGSDGDLDSTWNGDGRLLLPIGQGDDLLSSMAIGPDGKIILVGQCDVDSGYYDCIARLLPDGSTDLSFGASGKFTFAEFDNYSAFGTPGIHGLLVQPDGRILVAGYGLFANGHYATVTRLNANGTLERAANGDAFHDVRFADNGDATGNYIEAVAPVAGGKFIVVGFAYRENSNPLNFDFAVARLNADLTLDSTFNANGTRPGVQLAAFDQGGSNDDRALDVAIQNDGKIVVAGFIDTGSESTDFAVLRLNPDGGFDTTFGNNGRIWFDSGDFSQEHAYSVKLDGHQRIVLAGSRRREKGDNPSNDVAVVRLLPTGNRDVTFGLGGIATIPFAIGDQDAEMYGLGIQSDGKIVVAGGFHLGSEVNPIAAGARFLANGQIDMPFGGWSPQPGRFRLSFGSSDGWHSYAYAMTLAPDNRLYVAGSGRANSTAKLDFGLARLTVDLIFKNSME